MKFSTLSLCLLAGLAAAAPTPIAEDDGIDIPSFEGDGNNASTVEGDGNKASTVEGGNSSATRAAINDVGFGYASQNGGTKGGAGGTTTTVSSYAQFTQAVSGNAKKVVVVSSALSANAKQVNVGANTSIIGKNSGAKFTGFGLLIKGVSNVIVRNIAISKVLASNGDAIGIQKATNVWVDHVDVSSDRDHDKDFYDGLLDITHAGDFITISNSYIHDHWKASLVGHSDGNGAEDTGKLHVTYANNYWKNINSRAPSFRFGTGHIINNFFENTSDGVNTRQKAQLLVESSAWSGAKKAVYSTDGGFAVTNDLSLGGATSTAPVGSLKTVPYSITKLGSAKVKAAVVGTAGNTLSF